MTTINITEIIREKLDNQATGALFFLDANKKLIQTYFVDGKMVSIKGRGVSGVEAAKELATMNPIKFQFHDGAESRNKDILPETPVLLGILSHNKPMPNLVTLLSEDAESEVRKLFTSYVGPIADVIFEEQANKSSSAKDLITSLSSYINNEDDRKNFLDRFSQF